MGATRVNHVSVSAIDLDRSQAFYADLLGAEPIPSPNFGVPVRWLAFGDTQLHLFQTGAEAPAQHHFGLTVDDVEPIYRRAEALGILEGTAFGHHFNELPGDVAQLYLRDPAGNLVELDAPGASRLPADLRAELRRIEDVQPQSEENRRARLFLGPELVAQRGEL